jgi:protocatechuate 3,4-dioxygenase beta subunit
MIKQGVMVAGIMILCFGFIFAATKSETHQIDPEPLAMITGNVVDANSGDGIPHAQVELNGLGETTTTDLYGQFSFQNVDPGTYTISVDADGYRKANETVDVPAEGTQIEVELEPEL